jgi:hypothetical protein
MCISPEFKIYLVREFQRLKEEEQKQLNWLCLALLPSSGVKLIPN